MAKKTKPTRSPRRTVLSSNCELTKTPAKRAAAIQDHFPCGLAEPALRALANAGYTNLEQLRYVPGTELLKLHGMGPQALGILQAALSAAES